MLGKSGICERTGQVQQAEDTEMPGKSGILLFPGEHGYPGILEMLGKSGICERTGQVQQAEDAEMLGKSCILLSDGVQ